MCIARCLGTRAGYCSKRIQSLDRRSDLFPCMDLLLRVLPSRCFRSRKSILCPMHCCCVIRAFYLRVKGESMNRVLPNGSYALVCPTSEVVDGSVYAVSVGSSNATVKRVRKLNNGIALEPDSNDPTYKSQVFDYGDGERETLSVIGRVVWFCVPYDYEI